MSLAVFGIENDGLNLVVNLLVFFLVVIWMATVYWTYADARRRVEDQLLVGCATVAALFPFIGTFVYMILRPPECLDDQMERELEIRSAQSRLKRLERQGCPNCSYPVDASYLRCPSCMFKLKEPCDECGRPIDPSWRVCPFCEEPQAAAKKGSREKGKKKPKRARSKESSEPVTVETEASAKPEKPEAVS